MGDVIYMADAVTKRFATRLRAFRTALYEDQKDCAEALGVRPGTYGRWERGTAEPSFSQLLAICGLLGVTPTTLLTGASEERGDILKTSKLIKK